MSKVIKKEYKISVEHYDTTETTLEVQYFYPHWEECKTEFVEISAFEDWLRATGRYHEALDAPNYDNNHNQVVREINSYLYWQGVEYTQVCRDLEEYLNEQRKTIIINSVTAQTILS